MRERISINQGTDLTYQSWEAYYGDTSETVETRFQFNGMWDVETPNFYERMNSGEIINNPMYYVSQDLNGFFSTFGVSALVQSSVNRGPHWGKLMHIPGPPKLTDTDSIDLFLETYESERQVAIQKAWTNVDVSEIQALASIGEMPETLRWLASLTGRMISILRAFQQRRVIRSGIKLFTSPKGTIITAAEFWLEFRYAIRPLVFECAQATRAMQASLERNSRITARGSNFVTEASDQVVAIRELGGYESQATIECTVSRNSKYRAGVLYDIGNDINGLTSLWGLDQPLESAWELVPFSFIIDWFFNVGSTIAAWTVNPNLTALTSWVTEQHTFTTGAPRIENPIYLSADQHSADPNWWAYDAYCNLTGYSASSVTLIKRRTVCPPRAILPSFNIKLDVAKLIDLAAIGQALFRGLRK